LAFSGDHGLDCGRELIAVVGEILQYLDGPAGELHDGQQILWRHLRADELLRGAERAQLVGDRHRGHVEVQDQQAPVLVPDISGRLGRNLVPGDWLDLGYVNRGRRVRSFLQLLEFAKANGLLHAVLGDDEVRGGQAFDDFAILVFDADNLDDQLGGGLK